MRSHFILGGVCAFLAFASSVVSAPPYPVMTLSEIYSYWSDTGDDWGIDECSPRPSNVAEILACTGDGFSRFFYDTTRQDISGQYSVSNGLAWVEGWPMVVADGGFISSFPTFDDFIVELPYNTHLQAVLPTFNPNSLRWLRSEDAPFAYLHSPVSGVSSHIRFQWTSCLWCDLRCMV